ncbi:hypothetical protein CEXT_789471 [Caerostris extrusa]|uniref:Uncharacterized protein n=1 Tax=Caerostris extrusa TaxID=172846 RepID=A0AAV4XP31_CAEEX|nr:hypothetical protein CEXT_789471 [Caerostris extrusa]
MTPFTKNYSMCSTLKREEACTDTVHLFFAGGFVPRFSAFSFLLRETWSLVSGKEKKRKKKKDFAERSRIGIHENFSPEEVGKVLFSEYWEFSVKPDRRICEVGIINLTPQFEVGPLPFLIIRLKSKN